MTRLSPLRWMLLRASDADPWFFARFSRELAALIADAPAAVDGA